MLGRKTLLIIGAVAGADIKMPMGGALATTIAKYLNLSPENNWGWTEEEKNSATGNSTTRTAMQLLAQASGTDVNAYFLAGHQISRGLPGWTNSIDGYLHRHQDQPLVQQCGKLAIAQIILESERDCALYIDSEAASNKQGFRDKDAVRQSCFSHFGQSSKRTS
ncbi:hypothetical protein [Bradyrhizobium roseum]|uniref:hypothetical protein n=1 Tax=Bradyrhizobium roseum TaxID=3056648 RepID=UPI00262BCED7|nr:hypothetical protein [Bradyrhizobium roseus]WKA29825.1 hypothetical protein QUH67_06520 [Bradyrhizobium roseus]